MKYVGQSYAERAEHEKRCKNRLLKVREQSREIAQEIRDKVRLAKEEELKKLQNIREKELNEWKRRRQCQIQEQIDCGIRDFGNAHIAAIEASCEEGDSLREERQENDLMAAVRGRVAMLQEQRKRDKEAEDRLQKKKRKNQKTIGIQADFLTQRGLSENITKDRNIQIDLMQGESDEEENIPKFTSKPNLHKNQTAYNPQNYTSNSVDSSNNNDSDSAEEIQEQSMENSLEFNQITNLLKQRMQEVYDAPMKRITESQVIDISSESSSDVEIVPLPAENVSPLKKPSQTKKVMKKSPQKSILKSNKSPAKTKATTATKKPLSPPKKSKTKSTESNRVRYVDSRNMYETSYVPRKDLVIRNEPSRPLNAREEAQLLTDKDDLISKKINDDILRQLCEIRSQEALEKEKIRRDYERLRLEMDDLSKQEQELRSKTNVTKPISRDQLLRQEDNRQMKMNEAVEKALRKNVITCPPVARSKEQSRPQSSDVNVAATTNSSEAQKNSEINNLVKVERLKDLLEKINHQKRLILNELEKGEDVPGPDLERVLECLKKLEQEKATLDVQSNEKLKKLEELNEREQKVLEREIRLENRLRELFNKQQKKEKELSIPATSTTSSESSESKKIVVPPVEIIIKVQPTKSPFRKKKSIRCLDTLSKQPGKVYPKTPIKKKAHQEAMPTDIPTVTNASKPSSKTSTEAPIRPILKRLQEDDSSSTSYRSIPDQLRDAVDSEIPNVPSTKELPTKSRKPHHKLNPALMHYITRLLGMNSNIGRQLNVDVSSVATPGSSTIDTSGNNSAIIVEPTFDADRMLKLQQFIDENYNFLNEVNETIESVQAEQINDQRMDGIWRDALNKKKPRSVVSVTSGVKESVDRENRSAKDKNTRGVPSTSGSKVRPSSNESKSTVRPVATKAQLPNAPIRPTTSQQHPQPSTSRRPNDIVRPTTQQESLMLSNYAEYTANCRKKIADLTQMMEQVRHEKLRLIENSLSSGEYNNFTEYREIVQVRASSDRKDSSSQRDDPPSEEINNILQKQTRPFGVSKDSGISGSRPVTSSDIRDSPDTRAMSEENANVFQPIKTPKVKITTTEGESEVIKDMSLLIKKQQKPQRPPLSLKSFSPQIEKQHEPHELSAIAEIETPTASKVNIFPEDGVSNLHTFPDFDEYAMNIGEHHFTIEHPFPELGDLKDALPDMNVRTFVDPRDFNLEISKDVEEVPSNNSSLMDIMEELKKRNIVNRSFEIIHDDDVVKGDENTTPTATAKAIQPKSPRRPPAQSRIIVKTPENTGTVQIEIQQTPTKRKQPTHAIHQPDSPKSNDTLSGIQEIEKDFQGAGMSWAASLLKRSEEAKKQQKSSSSSGKIEIDFEMPDSSNSSTSGGRPLNLRDFLRRELMMKSQKDKYLSDESSLSSQFMRSLLNASTSSTTSDRPKSESSQNAKLRTSTPVNVKSSDRITTGKTGVSSSQQLFGPEAENVSSVRDSCASGSDKV